MCASGSTCLNAVCAPACVLFDLPVARVLTVDVARFWLTVVVRTAVNPVGCPSYGVLATGHGRGRVGDPLYGIRMAPQLEAGSPHHELIIAWHCYQKLRVTYHVRPEVGRSTSNGPTEAVIGTIELIRRVAHGFRNFDNYRLRALLAAGRHRAGCGTPIRAQL